MEVKKRCHSKRLLLVKRSDWNSSSLWKEAHEAVRALRGAWTRRKE